MIRFQICVLKRGEWLAECPRCVWEMTRGSGNCRGKAGCWTSIATVEMGRSGPILYI